MEPVAYIIELNLAITAEEISYGDMIFLAVRNLLVFQTENVRVECVNIQGRYFRIIQVKFPPGGPLEN